MKKDVRELVQQVETIGWQYTGKEDSKGLHILEHESGETYRISANPNDYRTLPNHLRHMEKVAGQRVDKGGKRRKSHKKIEVSGFDLEKAVATNERKHREIGLSDADNPLAYSTATRASQPELLVPEEYAQPPALRDRHITKIQPIKPKTDCWDGKEISARTMLQRVSIRGEVYDLALCPENLEIVEEFLASLLSEAEPYVSQVEKKMLEREARARAKAAQKGPKAPAGMGAKIREWLLEQGYEGVGKRGRFKQAWLDDYFAAHPKERRLRLVA